MSMWQDQRETDQPPPAVRRYSWRQTGVDRNGGRGHHRALSCTFSCSAPRPIARSGDQSPHPSSPHTLPRPRGCQPPREAHTTRHRPRTDCTNADTPPSANPRPKPVPSRHSPLRMFLFWSSSGLGRLAIMRSMRLRSTGDVGERSCASSTPVSILGTGTGAATGVS